MSDSGRRREVPVATGQGKVSAMQGSPMSERVGLLEQQVDAVARDIERLLLVLQHGRDPDGEDGQPQRVSGFRWECKACGKTLGFLTEDAEELRIRRRDIYLYVEPGQGGIVRMPCPACAHLNELAYTDRAPAEVAG